MDLSLHDEFWFKVKITSAKSVYGVQCQIVYPSAILEAVQDEDGRVKTNEGTFLSANNVDSFLSARLENDEPGKIVLGYSKVGLAAASSGEGSLFDILFRCVGLGPGELRFEQAKIYDEATKEQPSKWIASQVQVIGINVVSADILPRSFEKRSIEATLNVA